MSLGCFVEQATGFTGSLMTMVSSSGLDCISASTSQSSRVYCLNAVPDNTVFGSTILAECGGSHMTCLVAAHFAASFHVVPVVAFSTCCLVNGSITSETHSEVRPACMLSHWRTFVSSSVPLFFYCNMFVFYLMWKILNIFCMLLRAARGVCMCIWTGRLCLAAQDVTKHGDRPPSPMGVS